MKNTFLFLFFILVYPSLSTTTLYAQKKIDSTNHFTTLVRQPKNNSDLATAYLFFNRSKLKSLKNKNFARVIFDLCLIAEVQTQLGLIHESEKSLIEALKILENLNKEEYSIESKITIHNHLGRIYSTQKNYPKALEFFNKALNSTTDPTHINSINNNKAFVYEEQKNYSLAEKEYLKVYNYSLKSNDRQKIARSLDNLGSVRSKMGDPAALTNLLEALEIRKEIDYLKGMFTSYYNLSKHYKSKDRNKSLEYADKAYSISLLTNNVILKQTALELKVSLKEDNELKEYLKIRDSINNFERLSRDNYAALKYEKESEIKRADMSQLKKERWIIFSVFLIFLFVIIYFFLRIKHSKEKQLKIHETESRISKKIHDELANDVYGAMIQLQNDTVNIPLVVNDLENIYQSARDISQEKSVYKSAQEFVSDLRLMLSSFSSEQVNVIVKGLTDEIWNDVAQDSMVTIYRVLKELLVNMKKHSQASIASIIFKKDHKELNIIYTDNGIGTEASDTNKGSGLLNAESRIKAINGKIIFDPHRKNGSKINMTIPL